MRISYKPFPEVSRAGLRDGSPPLRDPQVTAWVVLCIAFGVFLALFLGASLAAKCYYDTASLPHEARLSIEQGIVLFRDAVSSTLISAGDDLVLREGDELLVGQGARAWVNLFDGSKVLLYPGSQMSLTDLRRSRFHDGFTRITLQMEKGTARIQVAEPRTASWHFAVSSPEGSARLTVGDFGIETSEAETRISSRQGSGTIQRGGKTVEFSAGEKVLLRRGSVNGPLPEGDQLVLNGDFAQGFANWNLLDVDEPGRPVERGQRLLQTEAITGQQAIALKVVRNSLMATHNETGLIQPINKDVSDYTSLHLNANVRVDEQSLSGGGYMGYEYPIMIRVHYRDSTGSQIDWSHGFFHKNPEGRPVPNGEEVPQAQWIDYSGNLMDVRPKPAYVISIDILGAGHSFAGSIANVGLVGK